MVSKVLIVFAVLVVVAAALEFDADDNELAAEVEFIKRDPVMQDFFLAEKRGQAMRRYKPCATQVNAAQTCYCNRRGNTFAFCTGAGGTNGI